MLSEDANIDTIARFGDFELFKRKFKQEEINEMFYYSGLLHYAITGNGEDIIVYGI